MTRFLTRKHEIERNLLKNKNFFKLRNCIINSLELKPIHIHFDILEESFYKEDQIENILYQINKIKRINEVNFNRNFYEILQNFNSLQTHKRKLKEYYKEKFDINNKENTFMLFKIWENLKGNNEINLVDKRWLDIGFQGQDPSTDFRGAGVLGLRNLYHFVTQSENAKNVFKVASDQTTWYFFCASGINFTGKIIDLIESKKLDDILINYKGEILEFTNKLYDILFTNFNIFWVKKNVKDFMKFNTLLEEFMIREAKKYLRHDLLISSKNTFY